MKNRLFYSGIPSHCYQNTVDGFLLFYSISDHLVYFTNLCVCAKRFGIIIFSACQMPDHIHLGAIASSCFMLTRFMQEVSKAFALSDSITCRRKGHLFNRPFGSAPKKDSKAIRTNIIYIGNNPVERKLCVNAEEYRWNFLAYAKSTHPFSEKLVIRNASWARSMISKR